MQIKFLQILPRRGTYIDALFQVDDKEVRIGITDTLRNIWKINSEKEVELFLKQFGPLKIRLMITNNNLSDYRFQTYEFKTEDGFVMDLEDALEKLKKEVIETEERQSSIGFKP